MRWVVVGVIAVCCAESPSGREAHWREDLQFLESKFSAKGYTVDMSRGVSTRGQKDFEKLYPTFTSDIAALEAEISKLSDAEIVLRLMKLVASANVAHNVVQTPIGLGFFSRLPITFTWYADGLAVMGAASGYEKALGTRVLKIGGKTPEEILAALTPYVAHENDIWVRESSTQLLRARAMLDHLGVTDSEGRVVFTLEKPGDEPFTLTVPTGDPRLTIGTTDEVLHLPTPLFRTHPRSFYWHQYLDDSGTLFIQYNVCANDPKSPFADFARAVLADADSKSVKRVVIDLRWNGGGDSRVIRPLKSGLAGRLGKLGSIYVLIGARTFSSGADNAMELRDALHAKLVGEPTGAKPSSYGEVKYVTLPNSKLKVQFTSKWFGSESKSEPQTLVPDVPAPRSLADALAGRDPALEAALAAK